MDQDDSQQMINKIIDQVKKTFNSKQDNGENQSLTNNPELKNINNVISAAKTDHDQQSNDNNGNNNSIDQSQNNQPKNNLGTNQQEIIKQLQFPEAYPHQITEIKKIITAVSVVFLTGEYAYKFNKPMNLGFLDFSTLEKRKEQCEKEVRYNYLISPELYLDVVTINRDIAGNIKIKGEGEIIEYAIKMKQIDPDSTMDLKLKNNQVSEEHIKTIADKIFNFHQIAPTDEKIKRHGSLETIKFNWKENFEQTEKYKESLISRKYFDFIKNKTNLFIENNEDLFLERIEKNKIKHCHGDFHSGNVFITNENIYIFDGIVFNERFPCSDVIAEIAFMAMDLDFHNQQQLSQLFIDNYQELSNDQDINRLLNFYKCYRAYIRGKIACFTYEDQNLNSQEKEEIKLKAKEYFKLAKSYAELI